MIPALDILNKVGIPRIYTHCLKLANKFRDGLDSLGAIKLDSSYREEQSNIVAFKVKGRDSTEVREAFLKRGVMLSAHYGDLRASFALFNNENDVDATLRALDNIIRD